MMFARCVSAGFHAQSERDRDFLAALAFRQQLHDFPLTRRQPAACVIFALFVLSIFFGFLSR